MPIITGLTTSTTRAANTAFAATFFPRVMRSMWPRICGTTRSSAMVEPFAFLGAAPLLKLFNGTMNAQAITSYKMQVPNPLWKNIEVFGRNQFEFDQTRTLATRVGALGVKVAQHWDYLLANVILTGSTNGSQNFTNPEDGQTYTMTYDNQPIYSTLHTVNNNATYQSNIIQGHLPTTIAALSAQDITVGANQMQSDIQSAVQRISTWVDDKGALIFPDFDPARQLTVLIPSALWSYAELAFKVQNGTVGGTSGSSSGGATNIGYRMVKDVIVWNLLSGCPNLTSSIASATVSPVNPTEYYLIIEGDYVKPFYFQRFVPTPQGGTFPLGGDPMSEAERIMQSANTSGLQVRPEAAEIYAATEIDYNLGALGSQAQESVVYREEFFVSARTRGLIFGANWMTTLKIDPTGLST
jgi:hypothetical protein